MASIDVHAYDGDRLVANIGHLNLTADVPEKAGDPIIVTEAEVEANLAVVFTARALDGMPASEAAGLADRVGGPLSAWVGHLRRTGERFPQSVVKVLEEG